MKRFLLIIASLSFSLWQLLGCQGKNDPRFLGSSLVEVDTWQIAPAVQGQIVTLLKNEGETVVADELLAVLDTIPLHWQREEILAGSEEVRSNERARAREVAAIQAEAGGVARDLKRINALVREGTAPEQQQDRMQTSLKSVREKENAAREGAASLQGKQGQLTARLRFIEEQIRRCLVKAPVSGRIRTRYRNVGEMASPSQPLFEVQRNDSAHVDFFVPQIDLAEIKLGGKVDIRLDASDSAKMIPAHIAFISDEAEFSPKNIQTRESRNELVFQVRAVAANQNATLKRGLPVEIWKATP